MTTSRSRTWVPVGTRTRTWHERCSLLRHRRRSNLARLVVPWRNIADPGLAADSYREALLLGKGDERMLRVKLDMADDEEDREGQIISFYKAPNVDWARPFQAKFQGDVAIGDGVTRHFLSLVNHKLQHGFSVDVVCERENANIGSLSVEQRDAINKLAVDMDYAILKDANSKWLLHNILQDAIVLDFIQWPQEGDDQIKDFVTHFISTASQEELKKLIKFWVGWEIPMVDMKVEVVDAYPTAYPTASTCFRTIRIPNYQTFEQFRKGLDICLNSSEFGFGLL
ncbi:unnamed protein product [Merluccius merluccius]